MMKNTNPPEFRELETLIHLERLKSFSLTAEKMFTTQSNISKRISKMENDFGKKLLEKNGKKLRMTPAGEIITGYARRLLNTRGAMMAAITEPLKRKGFLRIGSSESVVLLILSDILNTFKNRYPLIRFDMQVNTSGKLRQQLLNDEIDLAFLIGGTNDPHYVDIPFIDYKMGWFIHAETEHSRNIKELIAKYSLITFPRDTAPYTNLIRTLRKNKIAPYTIHNCASLSALVNLTIRQTGIGIFPKSVIRHIAGADRLKEIKGFPIQPLNYFISYHDSEFRPVIREFSDIAVRVAGQTKS